MGRCFFFFGFFPLHPPPPPRFGYPPAIKIHGRKAGRLAVQLFIFLRQAFRPSTALLSRPLGAGAAVALPPGQRAETPGRPGPPPPRRRPRGAPGPGAAPPRLREKEPRPPASQRHRKRRKSRFFGFWPKPAPTRLDPGGQPAPRIPPAGLGEDEGIWAPEPLLPL